MGVGVEVGVEVGVIVAVGVLVIVGVAKSGPMMGTLHDIIVNKTNRRKKLKDRIDRTMFDIIKEVANDVNQPKITLG